jgi:peptidoglycan/LPS O-acetylase OafA/YrhL
VANHRADLSNSRRIKGLDGVRAAAVVGVIAAHLHFPALYGGGVGVDIFFGLSGYLITSILLRERFATGQISLPKFWGRRALRLLPAVFLVLIVVDAVVLIGGHRLHDPQWHQGLVATPAVVFYYSNWLIVDHHLLGQYGPLWSLSVEEQFYILWPLIMVVAFRTSRPLRLLTWIATVVIALVIVDRFASFHPADLDRTFGTDYRIDGILAGCLLAIAFGGGLAERIAAITKRWIWPAIGYLLLVAVFTPKFGDNSHPGRVYLYYTVGLPLVAIATQTVIGFLVTHQSDRITRFLGWRPIEYTGRISYGMYLWHYVIIAALGSLAVPHPSAKYALAILLTYGLTYLAATLSWRLFERPLSRRFHDRLAATKAEVVTVTESVVDEGLN